MPGPQLLKDFSGGYVTDKSLEQILPNELHTGENCYWDSGCKKRRGLKQYTTLTAGGTLRGGIRAYLNATWYTFTAEDSGGVVRFYSATTTTFTEIDASFTWTSGKEVHFSEQAGKVIGVSDDASDWPLIIDYSGGLRIRNLEAEDVRARGDSTWKAGQWDDTGTGDTQWIDDTTDAQSTTANDFVVGTTVTNDGFWVACDHTFNKVVLTSVAQATGSPVAEYAYWNPTTEAFVTFTPETVPTWTDVAGTRTIEWDWITDAGFYATNENHVVNRFLLRVRFTTAASNVFRASYVTISHTQYLRQILDNTKPHRIAEHNGRIFLGAGLFTQLSPINQVKDWHIDDQEYFQEGGEQLEALHSFGDVLAVVKAKAIFHVTGNSYRNWGKDKVSENFGTVEPRSVASVKGRLMFLDTDGGVGLWDGTEGFLVSISIQSDIDGFTTAGANAIDYGSTRAKDRHYWLALPSSDVLLRADPDTLRRDRKTGEWAVSWFKYLSYRVDLMMPHYGGGDDGLLLGLDNGSTKQIIQLERTDAAGTDFAATAISQKMRAYLRNAKDNTTRKKVGRRVKPRISKSGDWTMTLYANEGDITSAVATLTSGSGTTPFTADESIPYTMDEYNIAVELVNAQTQDATVHSIGYETYERAF